MHNNIYALQNQNVLQFGAEGVMLCRMTSILTGLHNIKKMEMEALKHLHLCNLGHV
jgi:hypothetical protein